VASVEHLTAGFCIDALSEALARFGKPEIFNSDQGSQFTSEELIPACVDINTRPNRGSQWTGCVLDRR